MHLQKQACSPVQQPPTNLHVSFFCSLIIRGDKDERAVLCSGDKTYDLKIADTSNLLLFVPECRTPDQLGGSEDSPQVVHAQVWKARAALCNNCTNVNIDFCPAVGLGILQQLLGVEETAAKVEEAKEAFDGKSV